MELNQVRCEISIVLSCSLVADQRQVIARRYTNACCTTCAALVWKTDQIRSDHRNATRLTAVCRDIVQSATQHYRNMI